jgi:AmmeMemoRadiSam system protein B
MSRVLVRPAAVAGSFYPGRADTLARTVDEVLGLAADATAAKGLDRGRGAPKAVIVPHAGYVYSGPVAATAYAQLVPWHDQIRRVVLLGPAHRVAVASMAVSAADEWVTPLGPVTIDQALREAVAARPGVVVDDAAHAPEHSLEVQVPFLQRALDGFSLLPIVVGRAHAEEVADVLDAVWGGDETLIVISTDLSHYLPYEDARQRDAVTIAAIADGREVDIGPHDACGAYPVKGMLVAARRHRLTIEPVDARSSGDTAGPRDRVVGYASFVLRPSAPHDEPVAGGGRP